MRLVLPAALVLAVSNFTGKKGKSDIIKPMEQIRKFDRLVIKSIGKLPVWLRPIMVSASFIGSPQSASIILAATLALTYYQKSHSLLLAEAVLLLAQPLGVLIKFLSRRPRPDTVYVEHMHFRTYSFPSAHAYSSVLTFGLSTYFCLHYLLFPWSYTAAVLLILLIAMVGASRVYLGAHFPTDVLGGWLLAAIILFFVIKYLT